MFAWRSAFFMAAMLLSLTAPCLAYAGTPLSERVAVEAGVRAEVNKDLAIPDKTDEALADRHCLDGRAVKDVQGDLVEYLVNLECSYCGIREPLQAQRENSGMCIVVRHWPSKQYGESLKKALSYEALKQFSPNAANLFWDKVHPQTALGIPVPYEASLMLSFQEAAIDPEVFGEALTTKAGSIVNADILAGFGRITSTPTYILAGICFPACDFTAGKLPTALGLAKKARGGDNEAIEQIISIITNGLLNEQLL